jgi:hypothetical protein
MKNYLFYNIPIIQIILAKSESKIIAPQFVVTVVATDDLPEAGNPMRI